MRQLILSLSLALLYLPQAQAAPGNADVKYRGVVPLASFVCKENTSPSFFKRYCYDAKESYLLVQLNGTWYHYCDFDQATYSTLDAEEHKGTFYDHNIKGGPFDCRTHPHIPNY